MPLRPWIVALATVAAFGQDAAPFSPEPSSPWKPAWELTLRGDHLFNSADPSDSFSRAGAWLRLRWSWEKDAFRLVAGIRSALGSDGNQFNAPRWDQQPSNGTQVDVAHGTFTWVSDRAFGVVDLGFQENGLVASQAIWDRKLRLLGGSGSLGLKGDGALQEASVRAVAGRVRDVLNGKIDLAAGQVVLKLDTGPWSWSAHAGRWQLDWDPGDERLRPLPGHDPNARQQLILDEVGASGIWHVMLPLEGRWFRSRNRENRETSEEVQVLAGSRERLYWPQLSFTWQRLSSTGTLYPVNGDEWWFYRRAQGPRFDLSMPLPGGWVVSYIHLRQQYGTEKYRVTRQMLFLVKRF